MPTRQEAWHRRRRERCERYGVVDRWLPVAQIRCTSLGENVFVTSGSPTSSTTLLPVRMRLTIT